MFWSMTACLLGLVAQSGTSETVTSGGKTREYILYDPVGASAKPKQLILAFHGFGQKAEDLEHDIMLNDLAKKEGFVVAYPRGIGLGWNAGKCCGQEDDLQFVDDLLADLKKRANIDPNHVFVTGMSNGAMMAYRLAAERPSQIAAAAIVAGSMETPPTQKVAVPILHIHGAADIVVTYDGKPSKLPGGFTPSLSTRKAVGEWADVNGCNSTPVQTQLAPAPFQVTRDEFAAGSAGAEVILIVISDGGHLWPGVANPTVSAVLKPLLGQTNNNVNATEIVVDFFKNHR